MQDLLNSLPSKNPARDGALAALQTASPILVCTGFPVNGRPETDGPPGAVVVMDALVALGKDAKFVSWPFVLEAIKALRPSYQFLAVDIGGVKGQDGVKNAAAITIEIPGDAPTVCIETCMALISAITRHISKT